MNEIVPNHRLLMFVYCGTKFMCSILIAFITWIFNERCESTYIFVHLVLSIKRNKTFMCLSISNLVMLFLCARLYLSNTFKKLYHWVLNTVVKFRYSKKATTIAKLKIRVWVEFPFGIPLFWVPSLRNIFNHLLDCYTHYVL